MSEMNDMIQDAFDLLLGKYNVDRHNPSAFVGSEKETQMVTFFSFFLLFFPFFSPSFIWFFLIYWADQKQFFIILLVLFVIIALVLFTPTGT